MSKVKDRLFTNPKRKLTTFVVSVSLSACTGPVLQSKPLLKDSADATSFKTGIVYALPRGFIKVHAQWDGKALQPSVTVSNPQILPDDRFRYALTPELNAFSHDNVDFTVSNGLLSSINATTTDKLQDALIALVDIGTEVSKLSAARKSGAPATDRSAASRARPFDVTVSFDPFDWASVAHAKGQLSRQGLVLRVGDIDRNAFHSSAQSEQAAANACEASVCYRVPVVSSLTISGMKDYFPSFEVAARTVLPDPRVVGGHNITRAPCIAKTTALTISEGTLTKVDLDKPSEVVGCLSIPLEVLKKILAVPAAVFQSESSSLKDEKALVTAQTELLKAQADLLAAQSKLVVP